MPRDACHAAHADNPYGAVSAAPLRVYVVEVTTIHVPGKSGRDVAGPLNAL